MYVGTMYIIMYVNYVHYVCALCMYIIIIMYVHYYIQIIIIIVRLFLKWDKTKKSKNFSPTALGLGGYPQPSPCKLTNCTIFKIQFLLLRHLE